MDEEDAGPVGIPGSVVGLVRASGLAGGCSALAAGAMVALEFAIGGNAVLDQALVTATIGGAHLLLAGVEGILTAGIVATVYRLRPDLLWVNARDRRAITKVEVEA